MSSEQSLPPGVYFWNPPIKHEQSWYTAEHHNPQEEDNQPPWSDAQVGAIKSSEVQPCTDIDEAGTIEHEIDHRRERFCLSLPVEPTVP